MKGVNVDRTSIRYSYIIGEKCPFAHQFSSHFDKNISDNLCMTSAESREIPNIYLIYQDNESPAPFRPRRFGTMPVRLPSSLGSLPQTSHSRFLPNGHGKIGFTKESTVDDGDSPNKDNPSHLQHMKWTSASDPRRSFIWKSDTGTDVGVSLPDYPTSRDADI